MTKPTATSILVSLLFAHTAYCSAAASGVRQNLKTAGTQLTLAYNGQTKYVIALAGDAIPAEKTAANELGKYLQQVSGAKFSVKSEGAVADSALQILVGTGKRVKKLLPKQDWTALGQDGIVIKNSGKNLILAGGRPRGSLYAVYQFLEQSAGCRWWTPSASTIPKRKILTVAPQNVIYTPPFAYREHYGVGVMQADPQFPTVLRENGHYQKQPLEWGSHYNILGSVHTFDQFLPPSKYFAAHPEWYSDIKNGNKPSTAASEMPGVQLSQLCVTNPEVIAALTEQVLMRVRENPRAGYISVSANDNVNYCVCERCAALVASEGSQTGPMLTLVNAIAAKVQEVNPNFLVETLAYQGTEKPAKTVRPAANVIVRLAPIYADFGQPIDSERNKSVRENLLQWSAISNHLFYWNYVTNFTNTLTPFPNWDNLAIDLRFMAAHKMKGVFQQGNAYTNDVGDFAPMRTWIIGKLMWNPDQDQSRLTDEFLQGYYGAAAPALKEYLSIVMTAFRKKNTVLPCFNDDFTFMTLDDMNAATRAFDRAAQAANDNSELLARVQRERISLDLLWIYRYNALKPRPGQTAEFLGPADPIAAIDAFYAKAQSFGVRAHGENIALESLIGPMKLWFAKPVALPAWASEHRAGDVYDYQPSDMTLGGGFAGIVEDANSSSGKAARMTTENNEWAIRAMLNRFLQGGGKWRIYALARVETKDGAPITGDAFQGGTYDVNQKLFAGSFKAPGEGLTGNNYKRVDLGIHEFTPSMYIWFARPENSNVTALYIERIVLIRE